MTLIGSGFKAALIGCGGMGRGHAAKAKSLGIELVGYCDEIEEKAAAVLTDFYVTTGATMAITCAQAAKTKNKFLVATCAVAVAATAAAGWYMGVQADRYYEAANKYAACQREHDPN